MRKHLDFTVNKQLCIGCGRCIKICPSGILALDKDYHSHMIERGDSLCSECEQCLAVCPRGAIHLLGKNPEDSFPPPSEYDASRITDALMVNNHSHKRFLSREVDPAMIEYFIDLLANASDERNSTKINYTIIKTAENVEHFSQLLFKDPSFPVLRAPCFLIPHGAHEDGVFERDLWATATRFELLCATRGLGTFQWDISHSLITSDIKHFFSIPDEHSISVVIGFGWPELSYSRGTQRRIPQENIHYY